MTIREIKNIVNGEKLYEVTTSVISDKNGNYVQDSFIIEPKTKNFLSKVVSTTVYKKTVDELDENRAISLLRKLFGENASILAYATCYSSTKAQIELGRDILKRSDDDSCVSDFTCTYIVGVNKEIKSFQEEIDGVKVCVNDDVPKRFIIC